MHSFQSLLTNTKLLANAFESVQPSPKQKADLGTLFRSKSGIPISRDKGRRVRGETVYSCSMVGASLTRFFEGIGPQDKMMWIGFIETEGSNEKWIMKPEVKLAMEVLGWG